MSNRTAELKKYIFCFDQGVVNVVILHKVLKLIFVVAIFIVPVLRCERRNKITKKSDIEDVVHVVVSF